MAVSPIRLTYDCPERRRGFGYIQFKYASSVQQASLIGLQHTTARRVNLQPLRQNFRGRVARQTQTEQSEAIFETVSVSLLDILHYVPTLPDILTRDSQKALSATCKSCRLRFVAQVQFVTLVRREDHACVFEQQWLLLRTPFMAARLADLQLFNLRALDLMAAYLTEAAVFELARADWPNLTNLSIGYADLDVMSVDMGMVWWMRGAMLSTVLLKTPPEYHHRGMASLHGHDVGLWPNL